MPVAQFRRQMAHLAARADIVDIDDALTRLAASEPAVGIALTFDDGTADFCDQVLPVLVEYQLPATLYVATGFLDGEVPLPDHGVALSWNGVREAVATGLVTVGAHTHNHVLLDRCAPDVVDYYRPAFDVMWDVLGEDRVVYGSNWPVKTAGRC